MDLTTLIEGIGLLGVAFYIGSYAALQTGFIRGHGYTYAILNLLGASCVLVSLINAFNLSSLLIQGAWILISIVGIIRMYLLYRRLRFTDYELKMLAAALPSLPKEQARAFLDLGFWVNGDAGTVLTEEQKPISHLVYLADGEAAVWSAGTQVAVLKPESFIGEITYMTGAPANGTVKLTQPAFYFAVEAEKLRKFMRSNAEIAAAFEMSVAGQLRNKLVAQNQTVLESAG
ncbi:MAG: cyclic nucleotide-binding domain-containing protein [Pseudomonadota bacterium]